MNRQRPTPHTRAAIGARLLRELLPVAAALAAYALVQDLAATQVGRAAEHALALIAAERALDLFLEPRLQAWALDHAWQLPVWNAVYFWGHVPVIGALAAWLLWRHWETYTVMRTAFLISALFAITCSALYPVVPPRLLPEYGFVDTIAQSNAASYQGRSLQPLVNPYAAMPSLHLGWALLCGIALARARPDRLGRLLGGLLPTAMAAAILLTGNHFLLDGVVGIALCLAALLFAHGWEAARSTTHCWRAEIWHARWWRWLLPSRQGVRAPEDQLTDGMPRRLDRYGHRHPQPIATDVP
jgi:hypothetical protein